MKHDDTHAVRIECLNAEGEGIVKIEGRSVAVKGTIPGDEVVIRIRSIKRHTATGEIVELTYPAADRVEPACPHFGVCGGCRRQDIPYSIQRALKAEVVRNTLSEVREIGPAGEAAVVSSPDLFYYRNKMEFSFDSPPYSDELFLGLHEAGKFNQVFNVTGCRLLSERSNAILEWVRWFAREHMLSVYGLKSHTGLLRYLVIREGKNTGEMMINLVTSGAEFTQEEEFVRAILEKFPGITTVVHTVNRQPGSTAFGQERRILFGEGIIRDRIGQYVFSISPDAFFQTNTRQAEHLYDTIREFAGLSGNERLLDLYCGAGTIGIYLADRALSVTGVELAEDAVIDARRNAGLNGIGNISFIAGPVEGVLDERMGDFDVAVCDPPRAGIHPKALSMLAMLRIPRMVYVSCNIKALPRDLETFALAGYRLQAMRALDMAPHTPHIETVLKLEIE
ncbi:MAG: 23S rRNA (uracil(1939)-C(5))-methyltransferase RlmD [Candidatus Latescibacterota bacterium]